MENTVVEKGTGDQLSVSEWKVFLKARIAQEQGKDQEALAVFDELLAAHPDNAHLVSSRAFALQRLGREEEAQASRIAAKYAALSKSLSGTADDPKAWTQSLNDLVEKIDATDFSTKLVAW